MDFSAFVKPAVAGIPLIFVVLVLVQVCKSLKKADGSQLVTGNWLVVISLVWGLIVGSGYQITQTRPPASDWWLIYGYWFVVMIYGVSMGLLASGFYDLFKDLIGTQLAALIEKLLHPGDAVK